MMCSGGVESLKASRGVGIIEPCQKFDASILMDSLPPGWTKHLAPSGHFYYYNANTQESTYAVPTIDKRRKKKFKDRPRLKIPLTGNWVLVFCKSGRRFVHNTSTAKSFWIAPDEEVQDAVDRLDVNRVIELIARARGLKLENDVPGTAIKQETNEQVDKGETVIIGNKQVQIVEESEEYEEDEENEEDEEQEKTVSESSDEELNQEWLQSDEEDELSPTEKSRVFFELFESANVDPYSTWSIELNKVLNDDRYEIYDNFKTREEAFDEWSKLKIAQLKTKAVSIGPESSKDPKDEFFTFLESTWSPKLFYIEFKRKYRKDPVFAKSKLGDRDKEKLYREFSSYMKKSEDERKRAFMDLIKTGSSDALKDARFHVIPKELRDELQH